jgi:AcrR family transcriptional regulator
MLRCVATDGYAATTVPRVAAVARVSPNTFYAQFADKADCFLALCDEESEELLARLVEAGADVRAGMREYLSWWRERPESSRAYLLELPSAGERAQQQRRETHERFAGMFAALAGPSVSRTALRVMVAGITDLVASEVAAGRLDSLGQLEDELVAVVGRTLAA